MRLVVRFPEVSLSSQRLGPNLQEVSPATSGRFLLQRFSEGFRNFSEGSRDFQRFSEICSGFCSQAQKPPRGSVLSHHLAEYLGLGVSCAEW